MRSALIAVVMLVACERHAQVPDAQPADAHAAATVVDDATLSSCTLEYSCGLSHPGLGSSSRTTTVDFATCSRTTASESGPYEHDQVPARPGSDASAKTSTKNATALAAPDCARLRALVTALTADDALTASESAHMDSEACGLTLTCKADAAPRFSVQRQTTTGPSRVEQVIRAM